MTKELAKFILSTKNSGYMLSEAEIRMVINMDRLCQLLWRCGTCRFSAPAQYYDTLLNMVGKGGDYVRDISFTRQEIDQAKSELT